MKILVTGGSGYFGCTLRRKLRERGAEVRLSAPHGALVLAWAQAAEQWLAPPPSERAVRASLFGF